MKTLHLRSTFLAFPSPPPRRGWQRSEHCPQGFVPWITPQHAWVGTPGHPGARSGSLSPYSILLHRPCEVSQEYACSLPGHRCLKAGDSGNRLAAAFVGRSAPCMERVHGRVHIAVMRRSTVGTRPLPYWQACVASGTGQAPTCRAGLGGEPGRNFEESPTACSALVGEQATKLRVSRTGNALPKGFCYRSMAIFRPHDGLVYGHQTARECMVPVFPLIGKAFLQACC